MVLIRFGVRGSVNRFGMPIEAAGEVKASVFLTKSVTNKFIEFEIDEEAEAS